MKVAGHAAVFLIPVLLVAVSVPVAVAGDEERVVVSRPGVLFHAAGATDVRGRGHEKPLAEALATGYAPCPVCFAKTAPVSASQPLMVAGLALSSKRGVVVPPGLAAPEASQPFGVRIGRLYAPGTVREAVRNPYEDPRTLVRPANEQGAYGGKTTH